MKPKSIKPTLRASVFREAARRIAEEENTYACVALDDTEDDYCRKCIEAHSLAFCRLLKPSKAKNGDPWYSDSLRFHDSTPQDRFARTLGLLLCEILVKEGWTL